ncbi:phage tail protein [Pseudomonas sp. BW16M2]|uniref:phage tail-collar fiber domain-containing protein n=1 Tax=Pseudomonas sp. BW16M2 TaxID=2745489 RepID=UPI001644AE7E|nr:phage tail protein [Pseudomonas sp. BW16M2]
MARITFAGESLIAQKQGAKEVLQITRFIYANVPGLDPNTPIDRAATKPPASQIVHSYDIPAGNCGYVNPNQVVYSSMLGSDIGDFDWNWMGLESAEGVLFAVAYLPLQQKRRNIPPLQIGNNVTRNILVEYSGAQELTGITIDASTWQHDFTVRLKGIDERERLSNRDVYGRACFFGDGLQFQKVGDNYQLAAGIAYLEGMRLELPKAVPLSPPQGATQVWMHITWRREQNDVIPSWKVVYMPDQQDSVTPDGWVYCIQLADITSAGVIADKRKSAPIAGPLVDHFASRKSVADLENGVTSAGKARQLAEARQIALQGDVVGRVDFDGSRNVAIQATLADIGVVPGTYPKVVINGKGQVIGSEALQPIDIPNLDWNKITSGKPTTLLGYGITDALRTGYSNQLPRFYSDTPSTNYIHAALEIREVGLVHNSNLNWEYAPRLGFHWGGQVAGDLAMNAQGAIAWNGSVLYHTGNLKPQDIVPAGTLIQSFSNIPPPNCLRCNGAAVSRTAYAALFAAIGDYYGAADGSTTFTLPDTRGLFIRDVDNGRDLDAGRVLGTFQSSQNQYHAHSASTGSAGWHAHGGSTTSVAGSHIHAFNYVNTPTTQDIPGIGAAMHYAGVNSAATNRIQPAGDHSHTLNIVGDGAHTHPVTVNPSGGAEARPVNMALYYYIKY